MMRGLENIRAAQVGIPCRNNQPGLRLPDEVVVQNCLELPGKSCRVMLWPDNAASISCEVAPEPPHLPLRFIIYVILTKDDGSAVFIEFEQLLCRAPHAEAQCDDTARRCAGNEIKIAPDRLAQILFQPREESSRHRAFDPAPIDGEDATYLPVVPNTAHTDIHFVFIAQPFGGYGSLP